MKRFLLLALSIPLFTSAQVLTVNQSQLTFGSVNELTTDSLPLVITNTSASPVSVNQLKFYNTYNSTPFSASESNFTIAANGNKTIYVKFNPEHNIQHNSELVIKHTANSGFTSVDLIGQGTYSKNYYSATENKAEEQLKLALKTTITNGMATNISYSAARDEMFMLIDNEKTNGQSANVNTLECVYTGTKITGYTSRSAAQNGNPQFNTEHTFPQGFFNSNLPMRSDLHHLYPTTNNSNSTRGNKPFGNVTGGSAVGGGSFSNNSLFEPRDAQKGTTARAMMYFVLRYQDYSNHFSVQQNTLKQWHATFGPDTIEERRNDDIATFQGNRNPFIDYPQLVDRITNFVSNSVAPTVNSIDITQASINFGSVSTDTLFNYIVVNTGNSVINLSNISLSNTTDLSFDRAFTPTVAVNPGEAFTFPIRLSTNTFGNISETLSFSTGLPGSQGNITVPITANVITSLGEITLAQSIAIFPNPLKNQLTINSQVNGNLTVRLYNAHGQATKLKQFNGMGTHTLNTSELSKGVYFLELSNSNERITKKLIKN